MLELSDPLWSKLESAHDVGHVPAVLSELAASWDDDTARSLLYDDLCHQETCYGATYAVIPHLLGIAEPEENRRQRWEITLFLGFVALCAHDHYKEGPGQLQGLPETLEGWDRKRDCYRSLVASLEQRDRPHSQYQSTTLPRYREILTIEPVNAGDLEKILSIKAGFFSALPAIRALCERALLENEDAESAPYLLSGIAAADGLLDIARLLHQGDEGCFTCSSCDSGYEFMRFGDRIAVYGDGDDGLGDYKEGAPKRAGGFTSPIAENDILDARIIALLSIAKRASRPDLALRVRHFAGTFRCGKCGVQGPMQAA